MKFSVVIPLYNSAPFISRAINSVLGQTEQDFEIIVVNDGSTDEGTDIVRSINDQRIRIIQQDNSGVSVARNHGIAHSRARYVAFLDADDEWCAEFLETISRMQSKFPGCGIYATSYTVINSNDKKIYPTSQCNFAQIQDELVYNYFSLLMLFQWEPFCTSSLVVSREALLAVGGFPEGVRWGEDLDTWIRISLSYPIVYRNTPLSVYHKEVSESAMSTYDSRQDRYIRKSLVNLIDTNMVPGSMLRSAKEYLNRLYLESAKNQLEYGDAKNAKKTLAQCNKMQIMGYVLSFFVHFPYLFKIIIRLKRLLINNIIE